jgi:hypothetical protein
VTLIGPAVVPGSSSGGIQKITSTGGTVAITDPTGPTTNLEVASPTNAPSVILRIVQAIDSVGDNMNVTNGRLFYNNGGGGYLAQLAVALPSFPIGGGSHPVSAFEPSIQVAGNEDAAPLSFTVASGQLIASTEASTDFLVMSCTGSFTGAGFKSLDWTTELNVGSTFAASTGTTPTPVFANGPGTFSLAVFLACTQP